MGLFGNQEEKQVKKEQAKIDKEIMAQKVKDFKSDMNVDRKLFIDTKKRQFKIAGFLNSIAVYNLDDITGYELIEDGNSISSGGLGRAAVGAVTFGGLGAIVGAITGKKKEKKIVTSLKIKINMIDLNAPVLYIDLLPGKTKNTSYLYQGTIITADKIVATLDNLLSQKEVTQKEINQKSPVEQVKEMKDLLDMGIITSEEFERKKNELLGL